MEPVRLEIAPEVNLDYVRSDKFKTGTLSVQLITPINEKTASFGALLPSVLRRGTMSHPDMRSLSTALDLLYGSMLAWGVRLDLPLQTEIVDGCTIYTVNEGDLVACFSEGITDKVVAAMAGKSPLRVLFRDACFKEDAQKINIYEQFKQALDWADNDAFNNIRVI
mgnify:CR=1 FL=1